MPEIAIQDSTFQRLQRHAKPLVDTIDAVRADEQQRGYGRVRRSGLTREDELALLDALP